jgi:hypothetical protein
MGFGGASANGVAYNFIERWNHVQRMQVPVALFHSDFIPASI